MSRNSKSIWKLPYINPIFFNKSLLEKNNIKTVIRSTFLSPVLIGKTFLIFNGKKFDRVLIKKEMQNFKLGEFSFTKIIGLNKGKKKGKKKNNMGNTINPVAFRLGWTQSWVNDFYSKHLHYPQLLHTILRLRFMVTHILRRILRGHRRRPYLFSHLIINKSLKKINVLVFFYDTISQIVWDKFYRRLLKSRRRPHTKLLVRIRNTAKNDTKDYFWEEFNEFKDKKERQYYKNWNEDEDEDDDEDFGFESNYEDDTDSEINMDEDLEEENYYDYENEDEDEEEDFDSNFENEENDQTLKYNFDNQSDEKFLINLRPQRTKNKWIRPLQLRVYFIFLFAYLKFACRNRTIDVFNMHEGKHWNKILFYSYKKNPLFLKENFSDHQKNFLYHLLLIHKYFKYHKPTIGFAAQREFFWGAKYFLKTAFSFTWTTAFMRCFTILLKRLTNHMIKNYNVDFHFFRVSISSTNAIFIAKFIAQKLYQGIRMWQVLNPIRKQLSWRMESNYMPMYKNTNRSYVLRKKTQFLNDLRLNTLKIISSYNYHSSLQFFRNKSLINYESLKLSYDFYKEKNLWDMPKKYFFVKPLILLAFKLPLTSFIGFVTNAIKTNKKILKDNIFWINNIFNDIRNNYLSSYSNKYGSEGISKYFSTFNLNKIVQLSINAYLKYLDIKYTKFLMEWEYDYFKINKQRYRNIIRTTTGHKFLNLLGYKIQLKGRFSRKQKTSKYIFRQGVVSLNSISNNIDYGFTTIPLINSSVGIKIWLNWNKKSKPYIVKIL